MAISPLSDFNTSYVVIKQDNEKNETHGCVISIHHMLLLNPLFPSAIANASSISIHHMLLLNCYFNI